MTRSVLPASKIVRRSVSTVTWSLVVGLLLLEGTLRSAALLVGSRSIEGVETGRRVVLALGDSHTYGVHCEAGEAYPGRLRALLEDRAPGRFAVVNLGLPGTNSSEIVERFPGWTRRFRPAVSLLAVGVNNRWNRTAVDLDRPLGLAWLDRLRIVRAWWILRDRLESGPTTFPRPLHSPRPELDRRVGPDGSIRHVDAETGEELIEHRARDRDAHLAAQEALEILRRDLGELGREHDRAGVELILLTYPAEGDRTPYLAMVNREIRRFAEAEGRRSIDLEAVVRDLLGEAPRTRWFLSERDGHLGPEGYARIAPVIAEILVPEASEPP